MNSPPIASTDELKRNRAWVLLHGGTESDRRQYADACAAERGVTLVVVDAASLERALHAPAAVVYLPDTTALSSEQQRVLVETLHRREERPKVLLGLAVPPATAVERGALRDDLFYWLRRGEVALKARFTKK